MWSSGKCGAYLLSYVQRGVEMSISDVDILGGLLSKQNNNKILPNLYK